VPLAPSNLQRAWQRRFWWHRANLAWLLGISQEGGLRVSFTEFRARFLDWLEGVGADGVGAFLGGSLQSLIRRKAGGAGGAVPESSQAE